MTTQLFLATNLAALTGRSVTSKDLISVYGTEGGRESLAKVPPTHLRVVVPDVNVAVIKGH